MVYFDGHIRQPVDVVMEFLAAENDIKHFFFYLCLVLLGGCERFRCIRNRALMLEEDCPHSFELVSTEFFVVLGESKNFRIGESVTMFFSFWNAFICWSAQCHSVFFSRSFLRGAEISE